MYARARLVCGIAMMCGTLLAGCSDGGGGGVKATREPSPETGSATGTVTGAGALPAASPTEQADPAKEPQTAAEARRSCGR